MRKVLYMTESNIYTAISLRELRFHVQFFNRVHHSNSYDGDYVLRFIRRNGKWVCDDNFRAQINVVNGKVIIRRVKMPSVPDVGFPV